LQVRLAAYPRGELLIGIPALLENVRLGWKGQTGNNTEANFASSSLKKKKDFEDRDLGQCYKTLYSRKLQAFVIS
jgi:hypothetical protein